MKTLYERCSMVRSTSAKPDSGSLKRVYHDLHFSVFQCSTCEKALVPVRPHPRIGKSFNFILVAREFLLLFHGMEIQCGKKDGPRHKNKQFDL